MRRHRCMLWPFVAAAVAHLALASEAAAEELRYKFQQGEKLQFDVALSMSIAFSGEGMPDQTMTLEQTNEMVWTVEEVEEDGAARLRQTIERLQMSITAPPNVEFEYDSASGEEPSGTTAKRVLPLLHALVGANFEMTMSPRGEIADVKVPEQVAEALQKAPGAAEMGDMFTEAGFEKMVQQGSPAFPDGDMEPGREWTHTVELPAAGPDSRPTITSKYRYLGQEEVDGKTLDAIAVEVDMDLDLAGLVESTGAEVTVESQESGGKMYFDREAGRVHSSSLSGNMDMEIVTFGQTMHAHLEQSLTVNVKPAEQ